MRRPHRLPAGALPCTTGQAIPRLWNSAEPVTADGAFTPRTPAEHAVLDALQGILDVAQLLALRFRERLPLFHRVRALHSARLHAAAAPHERITSLVEPRLHGRISLPQRLRADMEGTCFRKRASPVPQGRARAGAGFALFPFVPHRVRGSGGGPEAWQASTSPGPPQGGLQGLRATGPPASPSCAPRPASGLASPPRRASPARRPSGRSSPANRGSSLPDPR
jgi:hypothetical protein